MEPDVIEIHGACEHNLKNVSLTVPKKKLIVFTGVSGSGKSSLAFDTIFAEGQRRYIESLSSYARQFLGMMEKPKFETIRGLSPTIAIEQKSAGRNPRSTVGTITEIYDYLRVLYARIGVQHCHICGKRVGRGSAASMVEQILELPQGTPILLLAPLVENRKGEHKEILAELQAEGFVRVRINGVLQEISDVQALAKHKKHTIEVLVDRLSVEKNQTPRLTDSVETALRHGQGSLILHIEGREDKRMSEARSCCGHAFPQLDPPLFSFNAPLGACPDCHGLGVVLSMDPEKIVPTPEASIADGAVAPWKGYFGRSDGTGEDSWGWDILNALAKEYNISWKTPWKQLTKGQKEVILMGTDKELRIIWNRESGKGTRQMKWEGLIPMLMRRYLTTKSEEMKSWYQKFMSEKPCATCKGLRLKPEILAVRIGKQSIMDLTAQTPREIFDFFSSLTLNENELLIAAELLKEIKARLGFLIHVGLDYLSLNRTGPTLSGGEAQRIRLASQIGSELTGVLYVLDEPSIGLHQRDNTRLLEALCRLRDIGNTVIVVEHDKETMENADWLVDIGPGAGLLGGHIVASGRPEEVKANTNSLTGQYLSGAKIVPYSPKRRPITAKHALDIIEASANNLRIPKVSIPLGVFVGVAGVSGAGKSSLINHILIPALMKHLHESEAPIGAHKEIRGMNLLDKVIAIDQAPIGRTPRSNPATYTKVFDLIRDFFAALPESKLRGFEKGRFSFNVKGGRCEHCSGDGSIRVEMHFLADVFVPCEVCRGKRFNDLTLTVKYQGHSIADVLDLSVVEARTLFRAHPKITAVLDTLIDVGLSYIKLGQSATTLSGGEAQRMKLSRELAKKETGKTLYVLDEPTTGLHFEDVAKLLQVLQRLVETGNTVLVIEHNTDVLRAADWLIDLGPEGGKLGGEVVATGTPEALAKNPKSVTGRYLFPSHRAQSPRDSQHLQGQIRGSV